MGVGCHGQAYVTRVALPTPWAPLPAPALPGVGVEGGQVVPGYFQPLVLTTLSANQVQLAGFPNTPGGVGGGAGQRKCRSGRGVVAPAGLLWGAWGRRELGKPWGR